MEYETFISVRRLANQINRNPDDWMAVLHIGSADGLPYKIDFHKPKSKSYYVGENILYRFSLNRDGKAARLWSGAVEKPLGQLKASPLRISSRKPALALLLHLIGVEVAA